MTTLTQLEWRTMADDHRYLIRDMALGDTTISETVLRPAQSTKGHSHPWPEIYLCNAGEGTLYLDHDAGHQLVPGARFVIPGGVHHRVATVAGVTFTCIFEGPRR